MGVAVTVGVRVAVGVDVISAWLRAANTALAALAIPAPHNKVLHELPAGNVVTELRSNCASCAGASAGLTDTMSETMPATCGAAMLVPTYSS